MQSTEICVQSYSTPTLITQRLIQNGFVFKEKYTEFDHYYTRFAKSQLDELDYRKLMDNTILLRTTRRDNGTVHKMVYKNKTLNSQGEVIKEEKVETTVGDIEQAKRIFNLSGFTNWCRIQINETVFTKGSLTVSIQEADNLGTFIEIKEPNTARTNSEIKFKELVFIANSLKLDLGRDFSCKKNYMLYKKTK